MAERLVPRVIAFNDYHVQAEVVTDSDAARLEAVVEAAKLLRATALCWSDVTGEPEYNMDCRCQACRKARAFDAALAALGKRKGEK